MSTIFYAPVHFVRSLFCTKLFLYWHLPRLLLFGILQCLKIKARVGSGYLVAQCAASKFHNFKQHSSKTTNDDSALHSFTVKYWKLLFSLFCENELKQFLQMEIHCQNPATEVSSSYSRRNNILSQCKENLALRVRATVRGFEVSDFEIAFQSMLLFRSQLFRLSRKLTVCCHHYSTKNWQVLHWVLLWKCCAAYDVDKSRTGPRKYLLWDGAVFPRSFKVITLTALSERLYKTLRETTKYSRSFEEFNCIYDQKQINAWFRVCDKPHDAIQVCRKIFQATHP